MKRVQLSAQSEEFIRAQIAVLGEVQERNPPKSATWRRASALLAPLFAEMERRQKAGLLVNARAC